MFSKTTLLSLLAGTCLVTAAPAAQKLQPWQVNSLAVFTPSGRPGSYPWATITANITDPNALTLGNASDGTTVTVPAGNTATNCQAKWYIGNPSTNPKNHIWPCDPTADGYWYFELQNAPGASDFSSVNFTAKFTRVADVLYEGTEFKKTYVGSGVFALGNNLAGECGGSGVCSWGLKSADVPFLIQAKQVANA